MTNLEEITSYAEDCISGKIPSCVKHKWACMRLLGDLKKVGSPDFPYVWDERQADRIAKWFACLKHSKGTLAGQPIILVPWEKFSVCQIYGWRNKDTGLRRFKQSFMEVGRKNAKSQLESGIALYECGPNAVYDDEVHEIYTAGTKRDQSKIVFNECDLMTRGTLIRKKFKISRDSIEHIKSGSFIKPLSKEDGQRGDGTNPACLILDEYHQHRTTEFYALGLGSQTKEPLLMIITTAGRDLTYPCFTQEYDYTSKILNPDVDVWNDKYFVDICEADKDDDPGELTTWQKANPIRAFYDEGIAKIQDEWSIAHDVPEKMIDFRTKMLDQWVMAAVNGYMDMARWKACEVSEYPIELKGRPVYVGFDLSAKIDLTSVAFIVPFQSEDLDASGNPITRYILWTHSFIPSMEKLREHLIKDKVPYDAWERMGFLTITGTPIVDQSAVMEYVLNTIKDNELDLQCLCFDPANASKIMMDLSNQGYDVEEVYQSVKSLNESTQGFREQVYSGNVLYKRNPLLNYAMSNAVVRQQGGLIKIDKDATTKRIDPVDATLAAFKLALYHDFGSEKYEEYLDNFIQQFS